jgi:Uncharacterized conserved protein
MTMRRLKKAKAAPSKRSRAGLAPLIAEVRGLIQSARQAAATAVNTLQVMTNFEIGRRIVEHEQKGAERATYGDELLKVLSRELTGEFGGGFSVTNLKLMRQFFIEYRYRIGQTSSDQSSFPLLPNGLPLLRAPKGQTSSDQIPAAVQSERQSIFTLSWSHYVLLLTITNPDERSFYEIEAASENWSLRELKRQVASSLYERLALSRDKKGIRRLAAEGQIISRPEDLLKEPYTLEFLGLAEKVSYSESDLEQAIIDRIEHFLLELGKGFLFEARQKRFTFDEEHFFVDLVFYNRLLRCYVLVDLKVDKLTHQDLGQMQMYVNYFDRRVKLPEENPTVGILLCKRKKDAIVELTLPKDANIHAREYKLYLPSKQLLKKKLLEWTRDQELNA